jgi:hypothetical protein
MYLDYHDVQSEKNYNENRYHYVESNQPLFVCLSEELNFSFCSMQFVTLCQTLLAAT